MSEPDPEPAIETFNKSVLLQLAGCEVAHSISISWLQRSIAMPVSSVPLSETRIAGRRARDDGLEVARASTAGLLESEAKASEEMRKCCRGDTVINCVLDAPVSSSEGSLNRAALRFSVRLSMGKKYALPLSAASVQNVGRFQASRNSQLGCRSC